MIYLVDASIYIFQAWQSLPLTRLDRHGRPGNAVEGFTYALLSLIEQRQPSHMLCAFDECRRTGQRNRLYPAYKADRPPAPAELVSQFDRCKQMAAALGIRVLGSSEVEADDIIGQAAGIAREAGLPVTIVSGDKDLAQFIGPADRYWDFAHRRELDARGVTQRFKVRPEQIPDWLALCGDKSDNIPGVPGVGAATAARLLKKWGTLDILLANLDQIASMRFRGAPHVAVMLAEHVDTIRLARSLTGLIVDPALSITIESLQRLKVPAPELHQALTQADCTDEHIEQVLSHYQRATAARPGASSSTACTSTTSTSTTCGHSSKL